MNLVCSSKALSVFACGYVIRVGVKMLPGFWREGVVRCVGMGLSS